MFRRFLANSRGFTLIELLIVVAIIAILAAIAAPQLSSYRKRGYVSMLNSDVKNAFTIAEAYLTENQGSVLNDCTPLVNAGFMSSAGTVCTASAFSQIGGYITVTGNSAWGLSVNAATINYNGLLTPAQP